MWRPRRPPRAGTRAEAAPPAPSAAGRSSCGGCAASARLPAAGRLGAPRASYAGRRGFLLARRPLPVWRPRRPPRATRLAEAALPAPSTTSSSSTTCCTGRDSSSSAHAVEQCIDLRSPTGKNETLVIYFMVRSTTEISYEVRFVCTISRGVRMVTDEKGIWKQC